MDGNRESRHSPDRLPANTRREEGGGAQKWGPGSEERQELQAMESAAGKMLRDVSTGRGRLG